MNKTKSPNYFKSDEGKQAALYKLWIAWKPEYVMKWGNKKTRTWFSYNKRANNGLDWLINHAKSLRNEFNVAIIYDNQNPNAAPLYTIPGISNSLPIEE